MPLSNPYTIELRSAVWGLTLEGYVWEPQLLRMNLRHNAVSTATIRVPLSDPSAKLLMKDGIRMHVYRDTERLFTGVLDIVTVQGPTLSGYVEANFVSYFAWLDWLPIPPYGTAADPNPADPEKQYTNTGSAEKVMRDAITVACTKWNLSYVTAETAIVGAGMGSTMSISTRFQSIQDVLFPRFDQSGIGIDIYATRGTGDLKYAFYQVTDYPHVLTEESGALVSWSFSRAAPDANDLVAGATYRPSGGTPAFRWVERWDTGTSGTDWGWRVKYIRGEGTGNSSDSAAVDSAIDVALTEGLIDKAPKSGFSIKLAESPLFQYGQATGLTVGKRITINVAGINRTDILREVELEYSADKGLSTTPIVGDVKDDPDKNTAEYLRALRKGLSNLEVKN